MEIYVYSVRYFNNYENTWISTSGIVSGNNISDAVERLENFFDNIEEVRIFVVEGSNSGILCFTDINNIVNSKNLICE